MFGAQKSMFDTARGQHLSAQTCGLEGDSRWRRHGDFILAGRIRHAHADVWSTMEERHQNTLHVLPSSTLFFFCMRQTVPNGHGSDRDAIWGLNHQRPIFSQHVRTNTQLSANKHTKARSHCLFVLVSSQKTLAHGNLAWQPVLVQCISRNDNSPHDPFVSLLMFLHVFRFAFSQGLRDSWRLMQGASAGALDRPFRSVSP